MIETLSARIARKRIVCLLSVIGFREAELRNWSSMRVSNRIIPPSKDATTCGTKREIVRASSCCDMPWCCVAAIRGATRSISMPNDARRGTISPPRIHDYRDYTVQCWVTEFSGKAPYWEMRGCAGSQKQPQSGAVGTANQQLAS